MFSHMRSAAGRGYLALARNTAAGALIATAVAGCSADVTRFDGAFGLTESPAAVHASRRTASRPILSDGPPPSDYSAAPPAPASDRGGVSVAALPDIPSSEPPPGSAYAPASPPPSYAPARPYAPAAAPVAAPVGAPRSAPVAATPTSGKTVEVQAGDTISSIARRHNVSIAELMAVNNLRSPAIKPGQQLALPGTGKRAPLSRDAAAPARTAAAPAPSVPSDGRDWSGSYTIKSGDNIYGLARQFGVKPEELQKANAITDVRKVRPGTVLKVPGKSTGTAVASAPAAETMRPAPRASEPTAAPSAAPIGTARPAPPATEESARPRVINAGTQVAAAPDRSSSVIDAEPIAAAPDTATAPAPSKAGGPMKLRWPVRGKVIANFGRHPDGSHNDGVNIQVPAGTDVLAAESGVVAYAGNEVKGYGNLVLVRHDNGWVTAYAHNDSLLVQRGDRVRRGQSVGKVGNTGSVDQPQLHFELRQGAKPVDPLPHMERM